MFDGSDEGLKPEDLLNKNLHNRQIMFVQELVRRVLKAIQKEVCDMEIYFQKLWLDWFANFEFWNKILLEISHVKWKEEIQNVAQIFTIFSHG